MKLVIKNGHVMDPASGRDEVTDMENIRNGKKMLKN